MNTTPPTDKPSEQDFDKPPWIKMQLAELMTPQPGRLCKGPAWWALTDDNCVLFYKRHSSPQCNTDRRIVEHTRPGMTVTYVAMAFVPHKCSDYC